MAKYEAVASSIKTQVDYPIYVPDHGQCVLVFFTR